MKTNTVRQRLALYKKALADYKDNKDLPKIEKDWSVCLGFCYYFQTEHCVYIHRQLPELSWGRSIFGYWFKDYGPTIHRIKALEKAIQRCEEQLKAK